MKRFLAVLAFTLVVFQGTAFSSIIDEEIVGTNGPDVLRGGHGLDVIYGLRGDDTIYGGKGADLILCGKGEDVAHVTRGDDARGCEVMVAPGRVIYP